MEQQKEPDIQLEALWGPVYKASSFGMIWTAETGIIFLLMLVQGLLPARFRYERHHSRLRSRYGMGSSHREILFRQRYREGKAGLRPRC